MRALLGGSRSSSPVQDIVTPGSTAATAPVNVLSAEQTCNAMDSFLGSIAQHTTATEPADQSRASLGAPVQLAPLETPIRPAAKLAPLAAVPDAAAMHDVMDKYQQWFVDKQDKQGDHSQLRPQAAELNDMYEEKSKEAQLAGEYADAAGLTELEHTHLRKAFDIILQAQQHWNDADHDVAGQAQHKGHILRSQLHNVLLMLGENFHASFVKQLHVLDAAEAAQRRSSGSGNSGSGGSGRRGLPSAEMIGWAPFVRVCAPFCADEPVHDHHAKHAQVHGDVNTPFQVHPRTRAVRLLHAAQVYRAFRSLPHDADGFILASLLKRGVLELQLELEAGELDSNIGEAGISHITELPDDRLVSWAEFVACVHAQHVQMEHDRITGQQRDKKKHFDNVAADVGDTKDDRLAIAREDPFIQSNGYTWEYVLVFPHMREREMLKRTDFQQRHAVDHVAARLAAAKLDIMLFKSADKDLIFCQVRASQERLRHEAARIDFKMQFDKEELYKASSDPATYFKGASWLKQDHGSMARCASRPVVLPQHVRHSRRAGRGAHEMFAAYESISDVYKGDKQDALHRLYKKHALLEEPLGIGPDSCMFSSADRIKLLLSIIAAPTSVGGAGTTLKQLIEHSCLFAAFPLHKECEVAKLKKSWIVSCASPLKQPFEQMRCYLGEKIALYFAWLGHYTIWLTYASVPGLVTFIYSSTGSRDADNSMVAPFCALIMLWSTFYIESWKQTNSRLALRWGMNGFEEQEQSRPQFVNHPKCERIKSPVTGQAITWFNPRMYLRRLALGACIMLVFMLLSICVALSLLYFAYFTKAENADMLTVKHRYFWMAAGEQVQCGPPHVAQGEACFNWGPPLAAFANAAQILVLNEVIIKVAVLLNNFENHRTETRYEDSLITKVFSFQFFNSFFSLFYIAFLKQRYSIWYFKEDRCTNGNCMQDLSTQLQVIFISRLVIGNVSETVAPWIQGKVRWCLAASKRHARVGDLRHMWETSEAERQFMLEKYDKPGRGLFQDYAEIIVQFGYVTLFVSAFPLAPLLGLLNNYFEIRVDAIKLLDVHRRADPAGAEDIGMWLTILAVMATAAVVTNGLIICFTSNRLTDSLGGYWTSSAGKMLLFMLIEHALMLIKFSTAVLIDDVPEDVRLQLDRQNYLVRKIIDHEPYDDDDGVTDEDADTVSSRMLVVHESEFDAFAEHNFVSPAPAANTPRG